MGPIPVCGWGGKCRGVGQVSGLPEQGKLDLLPTCLLVHVFWGAKGFLPPPYRVGQAVFGPLGVPALCFGRSCFSAPSPDSSPLVPSQESPPRARQSSSQERSSLTSRTGTRTFTAGTDSRGASAPITATPSLMPSLLVGVGQCDPPPKRAPPTPCPSAAAAPSGGKGGFDSSTAPGTGGITDAQ